jgi:sugar O-acyltransferase (sialic acid O-acetyltransferase NeuD family)
MVIVGAKGFAKQIVEVFYQKRNSEEIFFFDNVSDTSDRLLSHKVLKTFSEVEMVFSNGCKDFCLGIGSSQLRKVMAKQFVQLNGTLNTVISPYAFVSKFGVLRDGVSILTGAVIENGALIEEGALINTMASIHHDAYVGAYSEIAPGARILGGCIIEEEVFVGANAVILPKLRIGKGAVIGAGAIVTKNVDPFSVMVGNPAQFKRYIL